MRAFVAVFVFVCCFWAGCFDGAVNDGAVVVCGGQGDCPAGFRCVQVGGSDGRCVALDGADTTPPALLSSSTTPSLLSARDDAVVEFVVDEDLAVAPAVFANGAAVVVVDDGVGAFHVDVSGADVNEGFVFFDAVLVDVAGNTARVSLPGLRVDKTGPVLIASDVPARARSSFSLSIVADEDLRAARIPGFDGVVSGNRATFAITTSRFNGVEGGQGSGVLPLGELDLVDVSGNVSFAADLGDIFIDNNGPVVDVVASRRVSHVVGFDRVALDVHVVVDEGEGTPRFEIELEDVPPAACELVDDDDVTCAFDVAGVDAGVHVVTVAAFDAVGNGGFDGAEVVVDLAGPTVTSSSVSTRSRTGVVLPNRVAGLGSTVLVAVDLDDDGVVTARDVVLVDAAGVEHAIIGGALVIGDDVAEGDAAVVVRSVDDVGNVASATLATIAISGLIPTPCAAVDVDGDAVCTDFDGDRTFGVSPACPFLATEGQDCDDTDPAVAPRGFERPGDGVDNDCGGDGDGVADDDRYIFVTPDARDGARGSRAQPARLDDGLQAAATFGKDVLVAAGTYDFPGLVAENVVFGGYDALTWDIDAGPTIFLQPITLGESAAGRTTGLVDITFSAAGWSILINDVNTAVGTTWITRVVVTDVSCPDFCGAMLRAQRDLRVVDVDAALVGATNVGVETTAGGLILDSRIDGPAAGVVNGGSVDVVRSHVVAAAVAVGSVGNNVNVVDSVLEVAGGNGAIVDVDSGDAHVLHSTLRGVLDDSFVVGADIAGTGRLFVVNSVIDVDSEAFGGGGGVIVARGNAIAADCALGGPGVCGDVDDLNALAGCGANVAVNRGAVDVDGDLVVDRVGVDVREFADGFSVVAGDAEGACRDLAAPDIGP